MAARKILLADPEPETARTLGPLLRSRGYQVHLARDGSRALEVAVLRSPDMVLFDEACRLIDARTFVQILRTNPRTERIPVVLTGRRDPGEAGRLREPYLRKPYNTDEVLARIEETFRRAEAAREVTGDTEVEGSLSHMSVADLLQVFAMNKKSGRLTLRFGDEAADVILVDGRVRDARGPNVTGEKSLFRYLARRQGTFAFLPGRPATVDRIKRTVDDLLLEGMRQADEFQRLVDRLPTPGTLVFLTSDPSLPPSSEEPVEAELLRILDAGGCTVGEAIDRCHACACAAARGRGARPARGRAGRGGAARAADARPLLGLAELQGLRQRLHRGRLPDAGERAGKRRAAAAAPAALRRAADRIATLPGFTAEAGTPAVGTLGHLSLGEGLELDLVGVGTHDLLRPLWRPTATFAVGGLLLDDGPRGRALAAYLSGELELPVVISESEAPLDPAEGVRRLLAQVIAAPPR